MRSSPPMPRFEATGTAISGTQGLVSQIGCLTGQGVGQVAKVGRGSVTVSPDPQ